MEVALELPRSVGHDAGLMLSIDLSGKRAFIAGVADDGGFGFAIAKALAEAGCKVSVGTWPPAMGIFETLLSRGKIDEARKLSDGSLLGFELVVPFDADFDAMELVPEEIKSNRRYRERGDFTMTGIANGIRADFGEGSLDVVVHSLACNGLGIDHNEANNIGETIVFQLTNLGTDIPTIAFGTPTPPSNLICGSCPLGVSTNGMVLTVGSTLAIAIPPSWWLVGHTFAVQGVAFGSGPCVLQFRTSDACEFTLDHQHQLARGGMGHGLNACPVVAVRVVSEVSRGQPARQNTCHHQPGHAGADAPGMCHATGVAWVRTRRGRHGGWLGAITCHGTQARHHARARPRVSHLGPLAARHRERLGDQHLLQPRSRAGPCDALVHRHGPARVVPRTGGVPVPPAAPGAAAHGGGVRRAFDGAGGVRDGAAPA